MGYGKRLVAIADELKGIGISDERDFYSKMIMEIGDYLMTENMDLVSDLSMKRLSKASFKFMVQGSEVYFYTGDLERVDSALERLLKQSLESLF